MTAALIPAIAVQATHVNADGATRVNAAGLTHVMTRAPRPMTRAIPIALGTTRATGTALITTPAAIRSALTTTSACATADRLSAIRCARTTTPIATLSALHTTLAIRWLIATTHVIAATATRASAVLEILVSAATAIPANVGGERLVNAVMERHASAMRIVTRIAQAISLRPQVVGMA